MNRGYTMAQYRESRQCGRNGDKPTIHYFVGIIIFFSSDDAKPLGYLYFYAQHLCKQLGARVLRRGWRSVDAVED